MLNLIHAAQYFSHAKMNMGCTGWHICKTAFRPERLAQAETVITVSEKYAAGIKCITAKENLSKNNPLIKLNPTIGNDGLLRVGVRITHAGLVVKDYYTTSVIRSRASSHLVTCDAVDTKNICSAPKNTKASSIPCGQLPEQMA